jgi:hypothetical protein
VSNGKKLSKDVIAHWPEIFKDIDVHAVPIQYIDTINVTFTDGNTWVIDLDDKKGITEEEVEMSLEDLFDEYEDTIANVDFTLNTEKVKRDIQARTKRFLKKRK